MEVVRLETDPRFAVTATYVRVSHNPKTGQTVFQNRTAPMTKRKSGKGRKC